MSCTWFYIGRVTVGDTGLLGCNALEFTFRAGLNRGFRDLG